MKFAAISTPSEIAMNHESGKLRGSMRAENDYSEQNKDF